MRMTRVLLLAALAALAGCRREKVCPADQRLCRDTCVALATDRANCGACGNVCPAGDLCSGGSCRCPDGRNDCGDLGCVDLASDPGSCGSCGSACAPTDVCTTPPGQSAACAGSCSPGLADCSRACVDLSTDRFHCGACGRACGTGESCRAGDCVASLYLACYNTNEVREATLDLAPAGLPLPVDTGPISLAWLGDTLYAANSLSNTLSALRFDPPAPRVAGAFTVLSSGGFMDLEYVAAGGGLLYVSNASVGTLVVVDPARGVVDEVPLPAPPAGIALAGGKAYVAVNDFFNPASSGVAVVDVSGEAACQPDPGAPACSAGSPCTGGKVCVNGRCQVGCGKLLRTISIPPALASAGGAPMPSRLALAGGRLYVTLWNLDPMTFAPTGSGRLAVIDAATDALLGGPGLAPVDLGADCLDPGDLATSGTTLWVTCGYYDFFGTKQVNGGGFVPVDLSVDPPAVGPVVKSTFAPGALAFCGGAGYAGDRGSGSVLRLDPGARQVTGSAALCPPMNGNAYVSAIACGP